VPEKKTEWKPMNYFPNFLNDDVEVEPSMVKFHDSQVKIDFEPVVDVVAVASLIAVV
jgi:hypothetical protein